MARGGARPGAGRPAGKSANTSPPSPRARARARDGAGNQRPWPADKVERWPVTLELGIDVGDLDRVVQIDAPPSVTAFLQRMGRSGRRVGASRNCLFLATGDDDLLTALGITALWRSGFVDPVVPPPRPAHIYSQQVMALVLQEGGLACGDADRWVGDALAEVPAMDRTAVVAHMLARGVLTEDQGVLGMGPVGERVFGRRHFIDVVAAFSSPMLLAVRHGRAELGSVHPASLARRDDAPIVILLGGRSWRVPFNLRLRVAT
jgi:ATP-dependent Lhr-like helicase